MTEETERLEKANQLIEVIANNGRKFFRHQDRVARLEVDGRGRVWYHDPYTQKRVYTHYEGYWRKFTGGGTLRSLVISLKKYVKTGRKLSISHFYWPDWICGGDLWGYGEAMNPVREAAQELGIAQEK